MLTLNLNKLNEIKTVASTDEVFADTNIAHTGFEIDIKSLGRSERDSVLIEASKANKNLSMTEFRKHLFMGSILEVRGIDIQDGETLIEGTNNIALALYEVAPRKLFDEIMNIVDGFEKEETEKKSDSGIAAETLPDGIS